MNFEFHYYITKYLALQAGFDAEESEIIAYSSQYVDDNNQMYKIKCPDGSQYENYISQTKDITNPINELMRVYLFFHFIPGDPLSQKVRRKDGKMHLLMTSPGNRNAENVLYEAIKVENLYLLGIASHAYADTFAHQNFIGIRDELNAMRNIEQNLVPFIGHADAGHKPGIPGLVWTDIRLIEPNQEVDNNQRIINAAKNLYSNFLILTSFRNKWSSTKNRVSKTINEEIINETEIERDQEIRKIRIEKYKRLIKEFDESTETEYDKNRWLQNSINEKVDPKDEEESSLKPLDNYSFKENFEKTNWFKFQEAVKKYQQMAEKKMSTVLDQVEVAKW